MRTKSDVVSPQFELFPEPLRIERLDPQRVGGAQTRVQAVYLVRRSATAPVHRIFHDRHGWYCEEHGRKCSLVAEVRREIGAARSA